ncbi:MAG TPA: hypothetical protein VIX90_16005 [Edaphobacter sp.]
MTFPAKPHRQRTGPLLIATAAPLLLSFAIGCASPGPPRPPSLHLPEIVTDLTAQRIGDHVQLRWTTPSNTTDGISIPGALTAQLCRQENPAATSSTCTPLPRLAVRPGPSQTIDSLPTTLITDPITLLAYRIEILNTAGHSAGLSQPTFAAAGAAPPNIQSLRATPARTGATIEWQPSPQTFPIELHRTLLTPPSPPAPKTQPTASSKPPSKLPLQFTAKTAAEVRLLATKDHPDTGGTLDATAIKGQAYTYTAQRVRAVTLDGHTLELRSPLSPPVTVQLTDIFPPQTPTGLAAIPSAHSIDLSWQPGADPDLTGYHVYRRELPSQQFTRLTTTPVVGPAFSDQTAQPGATYAYRVTAVDATGNQSPPSTEVQETLREP